MILSHELMVFLRFMAFVHGIPSSTHGICKWFLWREWYERVLIIYKLDDIYIVMVFGLDGNEMLLICGLKLWTNLVNV